MDEKCQGKFEYFILIDLLIYVLIIWLNIGSEGGQLTVWRISTGQMLR